MRDLVLAHESTPQERLRKYKEELAKMARSEGKQLSVSHSFESEKTATDSLADSEPTVINAAPSREQIRPPQVLVSPSKRELDEPMVSSRKRKTEEVRPTPKTKVGKNRIMMKARGKAIDGQLQDIKDRKALLELHLKKKKISKVEYNERMKMLVEEGQILLKEKAELDNAMSS